MCSHLPRRRNQVIIIYVNGKHKAIISSLIIILCLAVITFSIYSSIKKKELSQESLERQIEERKAKFYDGLLESGIAPHKAMYWEVTVGEETPEGEVPIVSEGMLTK